MRRRITKKKSTLKPVAYRIPPELENAIVTIATREGVATNTMVIKLLTWGVEQAKEDKS
jgi:predicted HicB family RNase H-like nuclease